MSDSSTRKEALELYRSEELPSIYNSYTTSPGSNMLDTPSTLRRSKERQLSVVDWHGNDDAANPRNFLSWKKDINVGCIFIMCFVS